MLKAGKLFPIVAIVGMGLLAYRNSFRGAFVFDDIPAILENPTIRHLWPVWQALAPPHKGSTTVEGRPILNLSLAINYACGGTRVWGYHALNLTIHILAGLTLLGIVRRTLLQPPLRQRFGVAAGPLALVIAVIWVVHPLQTESVTYVIQRAESMMALFYLLTLYGVIRGAESDSPNTWYVLSVVSCLFGMASKEVMVSAPVIVLLYDRTFLTGSFAEACRRRWRVYMGLAVTWIPLGWLVITSGNRGGAAGLGTRMAWPAYAKTQFLAIVHYLRLAVWPRPLAFDYGTGSAVAFGQVLPGAIIVTALLIGTVVAIKRWPSVGFLGAWFFAILAPSSSVVPVVTEIIAEHRMYLPLAAVIAGVVLGGFEIGKRLFDERQGAALGYFASGSVVILFTFLTFARNQDYRSEISIWRDTVAKMPRSERARYNLGHVLVDGGRVAEGIMEYEQALVIEPNNADAHNNLGAAMALQGRESEAIEQYQEALRIRPNYAEAHNDFGAALARMGRVGEAIKEYQEALRIKTDFAEAHNNFGVALLREGRVTEAIEQGKEAVRQDPGLATAHHNLANALFENGDIAEAVKEYERAVELRPEYAEAHNNLGTALMRLGQVAEAITQYEEALRIRPDYARAEANLKKARAKAAE